MSPARRSYNACLAGATALIVLALVIGLWTVPAILHRPGVTLGPLLIVGVFWLLLLGYLVDGWRR